MTDDPAPERSPWAWLGWPLLVLVRLYQWTLSPLMGGHCRYQPTCSRYAAEALKTHNPARAVWLVGRRVVRCHPWGGGGFDPVPEWRAPEGHGGKPDTGSHGRIGGAES